MSKDHLFINYAIEDSAVAEWLTLQLTAEGYQVWCDRFKLLGGESYPIDIDKAMKKDTFRVITLLSKSSISKPNPLKERTLALSIAKEEKIDFLIPLNLDGLKPTELGWTISDLTFIDFSSWAVGLKGLLKKLESVNAPKKLKNGKEIAGKAFFMESLLKKQDETVYLNALEIKKIPTVLKKFTSSSEIYGYRRTAALQVWPFYKISSTVHLAFEMPHNSVEKELGVKFVEEIEWSKKAEILGVDTSNIISFLLKQSLVVECLRRGLVMHTSRGHGVYFPTGLLEKNKLNYLDAEGKKSRLSVAGLRKYWSPQGAERNWYHISPVFSVKKNYLNMNFALLFYVSLYLTNEKKEELPARSQNSRRKRICMSWWNDKWFKLHWAICHFLANGNSEIVLGANAKNSIVINSKLIHYTSPLTINESSLESNLIDIEILTATDANVEPESES